MICDERSSNTTATSCYGGSSSALPKKKSPAARMKKQQQQRGRGVVDSRARDFFTKTNLDLLAIAVALACCNAGGNFAHGAEEDGGQSGGDEHETEETEIRETYVCLFPWLAQIVGVFVYYLLSRYCHRLPYTAVMFIIGVFMGYSVSRHGDGHNAITESAAGWLQINGEVILLVFLPGLLYLDSYNIDVHLFIKSFGQILIFAFPMVLAGTTLTACVAYYLFPYGWSFDLSMTFGSILSATDPVAVAVLLNELGAPPRLKMHISGESLMNDGSAVVFYNIFRERFLYELSLTGIGEDIGWARGFGLFFRLSLGGTCIGLAFGVGTVAVLYKLRRRLSGEDSVVQIVASISLAYLGFFTSEILCKCSGIISVVFMGVTVKFLGESMFNDKHLMHSFWEITEWLLNTLLFTLAGCVWGGIISDNLDTEEVDHLFSAKDWGYLILLFVLLTCIRFVLMFTFYPIISRIGIGTSLKEVLFMSYGGLRGAVGIALGLSLTTEVFHFTQGMEDEAMMHQYRQFAEFIFAFVGGIAMLTLVINAPTCGPLLKKLELVTPSKTRKKVVEHFRQRMIQHCLIEYVGMLSEKRFRDVDWSIVTEHAPFLREVTYADLMTAVHRHEEDTPPNVYSPPNLKNTVPYLCDANEGDNEEEPERNKDESGDDDNDIFIGREAMGATKRGKWSNADSIRILSSYDRASVYNLTAECDHDEAHEQRLIFIKILRSSYNTLIENGEVESRGFIPYCLLRSLDFADDESAHGLKMATWKNLIQTSDSFAKPAETILQKFVHQKRRIMDRSREHGYDQDFVLLSLHVRKTLAFIKGHEMAKVVFKKEFQKGENSRFQRKETLTSTEKVVLDECKEQIKLAEDTLEVLDKSDVQMVKSHYACEILLHKSASYFIRLSNQGLMSPREASHFLEHIEEAIYHVMECHQDTHKDEMSERSKKKRLCSNDGFAYGLMG